MEKIYYLDDDNNIVEIEKATHFIMQELDENGNLIKESFGVLNSDNNINDEEMLEEPSDEIKEILNNYKDRNGNYMFR